MKKFTNILLLILAGITISCTQWVLPEACNEPTPTSINVDNNATTKIVTCTIGNSSATWIVKNNANVIVKSSTGTINNFTFGATDFPPGNYTITASGITACGFKFSISKPYEVICTGSNPTDITLVPSIDKSTTVCTLISDDNLVGETWTLIDKESGKRTSVANGINVNKVTITTNDYPSANYTLEVIGKTKCGTLFKFEKDFKVDYYDFLNIGLSSGFQIGSVSKSVYPVDVKIGISGNIYAVGIAIGGIFLAKYDKFGKFIKTIQLATSQGGDRTGWLSQFQPNSVAIDNDENLYITGTSKFYGNIGMIATSPGYFVAKCDKNGVIQWAKSIFTGPVFGKSEITGNSICVNSNGFVYVTGDFSCTNSCLPSGNIPSRATVGKNDIFVAAYTKNGDSIWTRTFGGLEDDSATGIASDINGDIYITGYSNDLSSLTTDWGASIKNTKLGGKDIFIMKLSNGFGFGPPTWVKTAGGMGDDVVTSIGIDAKSNLYITGSISNSATFGNVILNASGTNNLFISKYTTFGDAVWAKSGNSDGNININQILVDASGNSYIEGEFDKAITLGSFSKKSVGLFDGYVTKYSPEGNIQWLETIGGTGNDYMNGIASDNGKNIITNVSSGGLIFDGKNYSANNYLWRLDK